jgi:hypothetical protein
MYKGIRKKKKREFTGHQVSSSKLLMGFGISSSNPRVYLERISKPR